MPLGTRPYFGYSAFRVVGNTRLRLNVTLMYRLSIILTFDNDLRFLEALFDIYLVYFPYGLRC